MGLSSPFNLKSDLIFWVLSMFFKIQQLLGEKEVILRSNNLFHDAITKGLRVDLGLHNKAIDCILVSYI